MGDLFEDKNIKPMLIGAESEPFDDPDCIYELKLDGERCVAYLDPKSGTELRNKRNVKMNPKVPELLELHKQVKKRCILDGELFVMVDGEPNFYEIQRRSLMTNSFKIRLAAAKHPASFTAFDILYYNDKPVTDSPLLERKKLLQKNIKENDRLSISRYIPEKGTALYELAEKKDLEGVVAKRTDSKYYFDKRTKDWIKIKNLQDDDFVVCGFIYKDNHMTSIVLGQYGGSQLIYKGHVTLGVGGEAFKVIKAHKKIPSPPLDVPAGHGNEKAVWIQPDLVCTVKYMQKTAGGGLRQPVFKGLRDDKEAADCTE